MRTPHTNLLVSLVSGSDVAALSLVAAIMSGPGPVGPSAEELTSPSDDSNGFAVELASALEALAESGQRGHTVVQLGPLADTMEIGLIVGSTFERRTEKQPELRLRDLVTVADVREIRTRLFGDDATNRGRGEAAGHAKYCANYESGEILARRLEFATVIVFTHREVVSNGTLREVVAMLWKLNPLALVIPLERAAEIVSKPRKRIDPRRLGTSMGWLLELSGTAGLPTTRASVNSVVFRDPRPFHPGRLSEAIARCLESHEVGRIVRSRGLFRLASRPGRVGSWSSAGHILTIEPTSMVSWDPESPAGQELVFLGKDLHAGRLAAVLGACLLSDEELIAGPMEWAKYVDPFPEWVVDHEH